MALARFNKAGCKWIGIASILHGRRGGGDCPPSTILKVRLTSRASVNFTESPLRISASQDDGTGRQAFAGEGAGRGDSFAVSQTRAGAETRP